MITLSELLKKRVVYKIPGMEQVRVTKNLTYKTVAEGDLRLDIYYPANLGEHERCPAVVFVHGAAPAELVNTIKDCGQYVSWGQLIAASGYIAVTFNHRCPEPTISLSEAAGDVDDLLNYVREHAGELQIEQERLAIWTCSGGAPLGIRQALSGLQACVKCLVVYYGLLDMQTLKDRWQLTEEEVRAFSAQTYLEAEGLVPIFLVRAGLDRPELNTSIDQFAHAASGRNVTLDFLTHPEGRHAFDVLDDLPRSREIIQRTLEFLRSALQGS